MICLKFVYAMQNKIVKKVREMLVERSRERDRLKKKRVNVVKRDMKER